MKTEKSAAELEMEELLKKCENIINHNYLTIEDANKIIKAGYKLLMKCEELRLSRDRWREKYKEIKLIKLKREEK